MGIQGPDPGLLGATWANEERLASTQSDAAQALAHRDADRAAAQARGERARPRRSIVARILDAIRRAL